jgi:hypothetical protein
MWILPLRCKDSRVVSPQRTHRTILWPICAAWIGLAAGCSASGYPLFAKFSPDARRLVYQDARYDHTYVYDLNTQQRHQVPGHVACMDRDVMHLVLFPCAASGDGHFGQGAIPCSVATLGEGQPAIEQLPALQITSEFPVVLLEFAADQKSLLATTYETKYARKPQSCRRLAPGDSEWVDVEILEDRRDTPAWRLFSPGGIREGRYFYHPVYEPGFLPEEEQLGMDVQREFKHDWLTSWLTYVLPSPDGNYQLRIIDGDDVWHRLTLTDLRTMKKTVILDKNDAASDVMDVCGRIMLLPLYPVLPKY